MEARDAGDAAGAGAADTPARLRRPATAAWALRLVEEGLGGFTLFGYNVVDAEQVATLTASLRSARPDVVVATDEEGGDVTRLC